MKSTDFSLGLLVTMFGYCLQYFDFVPTILFTKYLSKIDHIVRLIQSRAIY